MEMTDRAVGKAVVDLLDAGGTGQPRGPAGPGQTGQVVVAVRAGEREFAGPRLRLALAVDDHRLLGEMAHEDRPSRRGSRGGLRGRGEGAYAQAHAEADGRNGDRRDDGRNKT